GGADGSLLTIGVPLLLGSRSYPNSAASCRDAVETSRAPWSHASTSARTSSMFALGHRALACLVGENTNRAPARQRPRRVLRHLRPERARLGSIESARRSKRGSRARA